MNCYHALAALGDAYKDSRLKHTGQVLLAMEIASVREYWHVRDHNYNHFPPLIQKSGAVGMIGEQSFYMYTLNWPCDPNVFPQRHACLIGIQVMPITSVSKYWLDKVTAYIEKWACFKHLLHTHPFLSKMNTCPLCNISCTSNLIMYLYKEHKSRTTIYKIYLVVYLHESTEDSITLPEK